MQPGPAALGSALGPGIGRSRVQGAKRTACSRRGLRREAPLVRAHDGSRAAPAERAPHDGVRQHTHRMELFPFAMCVCCKTGPCASRRGRRRVGCVCLRITAWDAVVAGPLDFRRGLGRTGARMGGPLIRSEPTTGVVRPPQRTHHTTGYDNTHIAWNPTRLQCAPVERPHLAHQERGRRSAQDTRLGNTAWDVFVFVSLRGMRLCSYHCVGRRRRRTARLPSRARMDGVYEPSARAERLLRGRRLGLRACARGSYALCSRPGFGWVGWAVGRGPAGLRRGLCWGRLCSLETRPAGIEPATFALGKRCSIQLSYERIVPQRQSHKYRARAHLAYHQRSTPEDLLRWKLES